MTLRRAAALAIGAATVWSVLALLGVQPAIAVDPFHPPSREVVAEFPTAIGLYAGDEVRVQGMRAGTIAAVEPAADHVTVTMHVDDVALDPGAAAVIRLQSLIGERYIELGPVWSGEGPQLEAGAVIPAERTSVPAEISDVMKAVTDLTSELDGDAIGRLVDELGTALDGRGETVAGLAADLADVGRVLESRTDELDRGIGAVSRVITSLADRDEEIGRILTGGATVTDALLAQDGALDRAVVALDGLLGELADLAGTQRGDLDALFERLDRVGTVLGAHGDDYATVVENLPWFSYGYERAIQEDDGRWYVVNNPMGLLFLPTGPALNSSGGPGSQPEDGSVLPHLDHTGGPADEATPDQVDATQATGPGPLLPATQIGEVSTE